MKARIVLANNTKGMYAADMGNGEYVIIELLDSSQPVIGDIISHPDFYSMGGESYRNLSQGVGIDVFVQDVCGKDLIKRQCFL